MLQIAAPMVTPHAILGFLCRKISFCSGLILKPANYKPLLDFFETHVRKLHSGKALFSSVLNVCRCHPCRSDSNSTLIMESDCDKF